MRLLFVFFICFFLTACKEEAKAPAGPQAVSTAELTMPEGKLKALGVKMAHGKDVMPEFSKVMKKNPKMSSQEGMQIMMQSYMQEVQHIQRTEQSKQNRQYQREATRETILDTLGFGLDARKDYMYEKQMKREEEAWEREIEAYENEE